MSANDAVPRRDRRPSRGVVPLLMMRHIRPCPLNIRRELAKGMWGASMAIGPLQKSSQLTDTLAAVYAEGLTLVCVELLGRWSTHALQLWSAKCRNACQAEMGESGQSLEQPKDGRYGDILAVRKMNALEARESFDETVDCLIGKVHHSHQPDTAQFGQV